MIQLQTESDIFGYVVSVVVGTFKPRYRVEHLTLVIIETFKPRYRMEHLTLVIIETFKPRYRVEHSTLVIIETFKPRYRDQLRITIHHPLRILPHNHPSPIAWKQVIFSKR